MGAHNRGSSLGHQTESNLDRLLTRSQFAGVSDVLRRSRTIKRCSELSGGCVVVSVRDRSEVGAITEKSFGVVTQGFG